MTVQVAERQRNIKARKRFIIIFCSSLQKVTERKRRSFNSVLWDWALSEQRMKKNSRMYDRDDHFTRKKKKKKKKKKTMLKEDFPTNRKTYLDRYADVVYGLRIKYRCSVHVEWAYKFRVVCTFSDTFALNLY